MKRLNVRELDNRITLLEMDAERLSVKVSRIKVAMILHFIITLACLYIVLVW